MKIRKSAELRIEALHNGAVLHSLIAAAGVRRKQRNATAQH